MRIRVVAHNPDWKNAFADEADRIHRALGDIVARLHHIGSTAIPGIAAKPIIDILMETHDIGVLDDRTAHMEQLGYEGLGEFGIPGRRYFRKNDHAGERTHHLHAFQVGSPEIARHLAFRDYMTAHPDAAREYSELKSHLATLHPDDIEAYMDGKDAFIKEHQALASRAINQ